MRIDVPEKIEVPEGFRDGWEKIIKFAEEKATADQRESLVKCLENLERLAGKGICQVGYDFAPLSFGWAAGGLIGGCIFHGPHDGGGDGGAPTFAVCVTAADGWRLHT